MSGKKNFINTIKILIKTLQIKKEEKNQNV